MLLSSHYSTSTVKLKPLNSKIKQSSRKETRKLSLDSSVTDHKSCKLRLIKSSIEKTRDYSLVQNESKSKSADHRFKRKPNAEYEFESDTIESDFVTYASEDEGFSTEDSYRNIYSPIMEDEKEGVASTGINDIFLNHTFSQSVNLRPLLSEVKQEMESDNIIDLKEETSENVKDSHLEKSKTLQREKELEDAIMHNTLQDALPLSNSGKSKQIRKDDEPLQIEDSVKMIKTNSLNSEYEVSSDQRNDVKKGLTNSGNSIFKNFDISDDESDIVKSGFQKKIEVVSENFVLCKNASTIESTAKIKDNNLEVSPNMRDDEVELILIDNSVDVDNLISRPSSMVDHKPIVMRDFLLLSTWILLNWKMK